MFYFRYDEDNRKQYHRKEEQEACEDGLVINDDFIAVIDGSTSKTPKHLAPDMKNGRYAMTLISEYI